MQQLTIFIHFIVNFVTLTQIIDHDFYFLLDITDGFRYLSENTTVVLNTTTFTFVSASYLFRFFTRN